MKKNIKIRKLLTIYLSFILASSIPISTSARTKFIPKSTIKTNKNKSGKNLSNILNKSYKKTPINSNSSTEISEKLKSLLSKMDNSSILNKNKSNQLSNKKFANIPYLNQLDKRKNKNYNQRINLKFSSSNKLLNGVALWLINKTIMKEIYNKLNITVRDKEEKLSFFDYIFDFKNPEIRVILPYDENKKFEETKDNLEKYLKTNFRNMCQSLSRKLDLEGIDKILREIEQQISSEISNINSEIEKINNASKSLKKEYYITKGQQFFEDENFKSFIDFINPDLYEFLKIKLNEENNEKNKKDVFSTIGKEMSKKELENLKLRLNKINNLKTNFSRLLPKEKSYLSNLFGGKYSSYYYDDFYYDYDDDDYDDDDDNYKFFKRLNYRSYKNKKREEEKRNSEITRNLKNILLDSVNFENLKKENIETLNENKKEYEKYMKNLELLLESIKLNKKQKVNSEINSKNNIEYIVGKLKKDYKHIRKMLKENKKKGNKNENLKNEIEKILNNLNLSHIFEKNKKQNNKELIKKAKEWLPIKIKYINKLLSNKKFKNIKGKYIENQDLEDTNLSSISTDISKQPGINGVNLSNLSNLSTDISDQTDVDETNLNTKNLNFPKLQTTKKIKNNVLKKSNKKTLKKPN